MKKILYPKYYEEFNCIGGDCEESCCVGWNIAIDKKTYQLYRNTADNDFGEKLNKSIKRNRKNSNDAGYAKINLLESGKCPFLDKNFMCEIYSVMGEGCMSQVCTNYPRTYNIVDDNTEVSLSMSCPEAARKALLNTEPMEFEYTEDVEDADKRIINKYIKSGQADFNSVLNEIFWDIRMFSISLVQNRGFKLWERLVILGFMYDQIQSKINERAIKEIPQIVINFQNRLESGYYNGVLSDIPQNNDFQLKFIKEMAEMRFHKGVSNERYIECYKEFLGGLGIVEDATFEDIKEKFEEVKNGTFSDWMIKYEYILENYLVNLIFRELFPVANGNKVFEGYMMLVIRYSFIKNMAVGAYGECGEKFDCDKLIKIIQTFSRNIEHNQGFLKDINAILRKSGMNSLAHMAILLRD